MLCILEGECLGWCTSGVAMHPGHKTVFPAAPPDGLETTQPDVVKKEEGSPTDAETLVVVGRTFPLAFLVLVSFAGAPSESACVGHS